MQICSLISCWCETFVRLLSSRFSLASALREIYAGMFVIEDVKVYFCLLSSLSRFRIHATELLSHWTSCYHSVDCLTISGTITISCTIFWEQIRLSQFWPQCFPPNVYRSLFRAARSR
jgi:hypothetical protein